MNNWAIAFPCIVYLAAIGTCSSSSHTYMLRLIHIANTASWIGFMYQNFQPSSAMGNDTLSTRFDISSQSISLSLDILLTLMIVIRHFLYSKNLQDAMGPLSGPNRLYKALVTIFAESGALYTVSYVLFLGPWAAGSPVTNIFSSALAQIQVRAIFIPFPCRNLGTSSPDRVSSEAQGLSVFGPSSLYLSV